MRYVLLYISICAILGVFAAYWIVTGFLKVDLDPTIEKWGIAVVGLLGLITVMILVLF